jgi:hypothetical protein
MASLNVLVGHPFFTPAAQYELAGHDKHVEVGEFQ